MVHARPDGDRRADLEVIGQGAIDAAIRRLTPAARIPAWSGALYAAEAGILGVARL
jgi:hypothetical protein